MTGSLLARYYAWYEERARQWNQPARDALRELDDSKLEYLLSLGVLDPKISGFHFPNMLQMIEASEKVHVANEHLACAWIAPFCSLAIGTITRGNVEGWQAILTIYFGRDAEPFEYSGGCKNSYTAITQAQYDLLMECMVETLARPEAS